MLSETNGIVKTRPMSCFVLIWLKRLHQYYFAVHLSLSVFVGFSFDISFKTFVGEGHERTFHLLNFRLFFSGVLSEAIVNC